MDFSGFLTTPVLMALSLRALSYLVFWSRSGRIESQHHHRDPARPLYRAPDDRPDTGQAVKTGGRL